MVVHYGVRTNQTLEEREASPIIHLKKLSSWIKSVLIQLYARREDVVLDFARGKGGDLIKWDKAKIGYYVGTNIVEGSIEDYCTRYNGDTDHHQRRKKFTFPARLICGDYFEVRLDRVLEDDAPFDIFSCQLAMHYSWSTEARARRALGQCIQHYFVQKASSLERCQMPMLSSKSLTKVHQLCSGVSSGIIKLT